MTTLLLSISVSAHPGANPDAYEKKVILRYRSDLEGENSNIASRHREKNVRDMAYPSPNYFDPVRVAWLNGTSSYIHFDLDEDIDISAFENGVAEGFTITAWICPEYVDDYQPVFWIENGFSLSIEHGALIGEVTIKTPESNRESLEISTESNLLKANEWIMLAFRDSVIKSDTTSAMHHLELWIDHRKISTKTISSSGAHYAVRAQCNGKATVAGIGVHQIDIGDKRGPIRFFDGMVMALEMKNYPADPGYLQLYPPDDLTMCFGIPMYLDRSLDSAGGVAEKRILASLMPGVKAECYLPFQNSGYIASGLAVLEDETDPKFPHHIFLGLNWKDETGRIDKEGKHPPIIVDLVPDEGRYKVERFFKLDGELRKESIAALAAFNLGMKQYLFVLSGERHTESNEIYQLLGKYELRSTFRFDNATWPMRYWRLPIFASKNDIWDGGQGWMKFVPAEGDNSALWLGAFAHLVNSSKVAHNDSLGWLYKFLVSNDGNLKHPASGEENLVSGTNVMYQRAWRMPTYFKDGKDAQLSNINGGALIRENGLLYWIFSEGYAEETNFLRKYPFDEQTGFQHSIAYFPIPAGTREIDLLGKDSLIAFSNSGCLFLQHEKAYYPWHSVCFPLIYSVRINEFRRK
ncbi:hypothetical protein JXJ21_10400 [candidate division KSB1 bacterium]|nr:hypothetical protein [candidate division KSB1 bacterium]